MTNAIEIRGLRKEYKGFMLKDVSFDVPEGYIMGLIGPNGAGKTTIMKLIMNLIHRRAGEIRIFGMDNIRDEAAIKSRIGFVYDVPCYPEDSKLSDIASAIAPLYERWDHAQFGRLMDEFELPAKTNFKKLSHGMKMKFSLAVALAHDADLILMDEPTSGLDPVFRLNLLERLRGILQNERKSILFSTHITSDLERIADFVTFVRGGEIVFSAGRDEILERWGIVRGGNGDVRSDAVPGFRGLRRTAACTEVLTDDIAAARAALGTGVACDRASLEDIMYFTGKGGFDA